MPFIPLKSIQLNDNLNEFQKVFNEEIKHIKPYISKFKISEIEIYSTCLGLSQYYLKDIGIPPNYEYFYQAVFDIYFGNFVGDDVLYYNANQYLLSLRN